MHVKDIMTPEVVVIDKDQNIHDALKLMKKNKISKLPVVNTDNEKTKKLVGIVTEKDIASRLGSSRYGNLAPSHFHVSTVMNTDPLTVKSNERAGTAAKIMIDNEISVMPVLDDDNLVGILTKTDFMDICQGKPFLNIHVKERMKKDPITVSPKDRLVHARRLIIDENIGRLLVVENHDLEGIITTKDIAKSMISFRKVVPDKYKPARIRNLLVEDVMTQNIVTVNEDTSIAEASKMMIDNDFSGMPVLDDENKISGIITKTGLVRLVVEMEY